MRVPVVLLLVLPACNGSLKGFELTDPTQASDPSEPYGGHHGPGDRPGSTDSDTADTGGETEDTDVTELADDDANLVEATLPVALACNEPFTATVVAHNTGAATRTYDALYKLGAVDDEDPFKAGDVRVWLDEADVVPPGAEHAFTIEMTAPSVPGTYVTDWQMVHEKVHWFGEMVSSTVEVSCDVVDSPAGPPVLDDVVWLHADVSGWAQTATLSSVVVDADEICLDYDHADLWPIYDLDGTEVVANPWIFIWQDSVWYAGTWEWLRPGQTCKAVDAVAGSHIKADPFGEFSGWVPTPGQTYYFMVSGLGRWDERTVEERSNLVEVVW